MEGRSPVPPVKGRTMNKLGAQQADGNGTHVTKRIN